MHEYIVKMQMLDDYGSLADMSNNQDALMVSSIDKKSDSRRRTDNAVERLLSPDGA